MYARAIGWRATLLTVLLVAGLLLACEGGQPDPATQPIGQPAVPAIPATGGPLPGPSSYRIKTEWRAGGREGAVDHAWLTEVVMYPFAFHQKAEGQAETELVLLGNTLWTRIDEGPWQQTTLSPEEAQNWETLTRQPQPAQIEEQTPPEDAVTWLLAQPSVRIAKGSLTAAGTDTVNDVRCQKYAVDSTYIYRVAYQAPLSGSATVTEQQQGEIWLADQNGWPAFVVRARLLGTTTTQIAGGPSNTEVQWLEQDVTDLDSPDITIQAPQ